MNVNLISYSQGVDGKNLLEQVAYAARVSNPTNQNNSETAEKLVRYLINNQHWSPLEMVSVCLEIETTRDIARQILRHRSFSFQEFSQRYADASQLGYELKEARLQDTKNRQNSIETDDAQLAETWRQRQHQVMDEILDTYHWAINNGIAKEQARAVLPEGMTKSRSANGTQKEHREVALACAASIEPIFPMIKEYVNE
jgi:thymidylate synthase (FAD)